MDEVKYINTLLITKNAIQKNIGDVVREMRKHDKKMYKTLCGEIENMMLQAMGKIDSIRYMIEARDC